MMVPPCDGMAANGLFGMDVVATHFDRGGSRGLGRRGTPMAFMGNARRKGLAAETGSLEQASQEDRAIDSRIHGDFTALEGASDKDQFILACLDVDSGSRGKPGIPDDKFHRTPPAALRIGTDPSQSDPTLT